MANRFYIFKITFLLFFTAHISHSVPSITPTDSPLSAEVLSKAFTLAKDICMHLAKFTDDHNIYKENISDNSYSEFVSFENLRYQTFTNGMDLPNDRYNALVNIAAIAKQEEGDKSLEYEIDDVKYQIGYSKIYSYPRITSSANNFAYLIKDRKVILICPVKKQP
jgi:hypothetical protein